MKPVRVLLVYDHQLVREGLKLLLESTGEIAVAAAVHDGREAVRVIRKLHPDLIVVCVARTEFVGIASARHIRDAYPRLNVVVLLMLSAPDYLCQLLAGQALGHVIKPSSTVELVEAVHAVHEGRPHSSIIHPPSRRRGSPSRASGRGDPFGVLSRREREVLRLVVAGRTSKAIAERLKIAASTVDTYRSRVMEKFGLTSIAALVKFAIENGIAPRA